MYVYVFVAYCMLSDLKVLCILLYLGFLLDEINKAHIFDVVDDVLIGRKHMPINILVENKGVDIFFHYQITFKHACKNTSPEKKFLFHIKCCQWAYFML